MILNRKKVSNAFDANNGSPNKDRGAQFYSLMLKNRLYSKPINNKVSFFPFGGPKL